ncbi:MAG: hypothetical protein ABIB71_07320 [Candidatus Woesearchaeota archaeon]
MRLKPLLLASILGIVPACTTALAATPSKEDPVETVCREVVPGHNDLSEKRINILFTGVNYSLEEFKEKVDLSVNGGKNHKGLLEIEPFSSNKDAFNFWYVNGTSNVEGVGLTKEVRKAVEDLAKNCSLPNDVTVGLVNESFTSKSSLATLSYLNIHTLNIKEIGEMQDKVSSYDEGDCYGSAGVCHILDFDGNEFVDGKDKEMLYSGNISKGSMEDVCNYFHDGKQCLKALSKGRMEDVGVYVSGFKVMVESLHAFDYCPAMSAIRGKAEPYDSSLCRILVPDIDFGTVLISDSDFNNGDDWTLAHELGHGLFGLHDEYVNLSEVKDEDKHLKKLEENGVNCFVARKKEWCENDAPWSGMIGEHKEIGCFKGCYYVEEIGGKGVWRSVDKGLMEGDSYSYGAWDESIACRVIYIATQKAAGVCLEDLK